MSEIRIANLRKEYKDVVAVNDVTITFPSSTVTCLLGPSGCGKTTLLRMIAGLEEPTRGDIFFGDERVTDQAPSKRNIGMVFQYPVVYKGLTAYGNIELPLIEDRLPEAERKQRIHEVAEILDLQDSLDKDPDQLDTSTRQKVAVARAVARQPRIILFDEPITNVDVNAKVQLKTALKALTRQLKQTIIYVTHDQTEAMTLADQIALMKDGVVVQRDTPRELYAHPNDVFGGWFLGNPGMNFFPLELVPQDDAMVLSSPLFPAPVRVSGITDRRVQFGIRPENIKIETEQTPRSVSGELVRKAVVVGGQYLLAVKVGEQTFKAKVRPEVGRRAQKQVWVEFPLRDIVVFGDEGHRLDAGLSQPALQTAA
jgi:ABC-type sugar transport system ATPase subunit